MLEEIKKIEQNQGIKELHVINEAILKNLKIRMSGNDNVINEIAMLENAKERLINKLKGL